MLVGPPQVGKGTLALNFAQAVNCTRPEDAPCGECSQCRRIASNHHSDIQVIGVGLGNGDGPRRREIGIGTVRELQHQASLKPYEGSCRVFIFDGAEDMSDEAANALLKILEEPPPQVLLLLLTAEEESILPTIRSRCRRLELHPLPLSVVAGEVSAYGSIGREDVEMLARLSKGCLGWALDALAEPSVLEGRSAQVERIAGLSEASLQDRFGYSADLATRYFKDREDVKQELNQWLRWWRDILLIREGSEGFVCNMDWVETLRRSAGDVTAAQIVRTIKALQDSIEALESNANPRLVLDVMMLTLPGRRTEKWQGQ